MNTFRKILAFVLVVIVGLGLFGILTDSVNRSSQVIATLFWSFWLLVVGYFEYQHNKRLVSEKNQKEQDEE